MSTLELPTELAPTSRPATGRLIQVVNAFSMSRLVFGAFWRLLFYDALCWIAFARAYQFVHRCRQSARSPSPETVERVVWAVEEACIWYYKRTYCMQRSAVCTWMLRTQGVAAQLVIGYRPMPLDSHAWVEVNGAVVNDRPQYQKFFRVLDRL